MILKRTEESIMNTYLTIFLFRFNPCTTTIYKVQTFASATLVSYDAVNNIVTTV